MTQRAFRPPAWDVNPSGFIPPSYGQQHDDDFTPFFPNTSPGFNPPPPGMNQPPSFAGYHGGGQNMPYMMGHRGQEMNGFYGPGPYGNGPMKVMGLPPPHAAQFHPSMYQQRPPMYDPYSGAPMDSRYLSSTENIPPHSQMNFMQHPPFQRHSMPQPPNGNQFPDVGQWNAQPMGPNDNIWRDPDELRRKQEKLNGTQHWGNPEKQSQKIRRWTDGDNKYTEQLEFIPEIKFDSIDLPSTNPFIGDLSSDNGEMGWGDVFPLDKHKLNKIWIPHPSEMIGIPQRISPDESNQHHHISQRPVSMINPPSHPSNGNMWANPTAEFNNGSNGSDIQYISPGMQEHSSVASFHAWQRGGRSPIQSPRLHHFDDSENFNSIPDLGCNVEHLLQEDRLDFLMKNVKL